MKFRLRLFTMQYTCLRYTSYLCFTRRFSQSIRESKYKFTKVAPNHPYKHLYPWATREEFVDSLCKSLIYHDNGLIAINKPFAVAVDNPLKIGVDKGRSKSVSQTISTSGIPEFSYSITDILPLLMARLKLDFLKIVKSPERYTSGILLLAYKESAAEDISKALVRAKSSRKPQFTYWALTTCIPPTSHVALQKVGLKLVDVKDFKQTAPIIVQKMSRKALLYKEVRSIMVKMETISVNQLINTALVEITTNSISKHFLRVYLAHKLAPILGDAMYASRVKMVFGKPVEVSPFNRAAYNPQIISPQLCNHLQLPQNKSDVIPTHLHLHQLTLLGFNKKEDLILEAPAPEYFKWSLNQLELSTDEPEKLKELRSTN